MSVQSVQTANFDPVKFLKNIADKKTPENLLLEYCAAKESADFEGRGDSGAVQNMMHNKMSAELGISFVDSQTLHLHLQSIFN